MLHLSCSAWVNVSNNFRPLLPNQFFFYFYDCYSICLWPVIRLKCIIYVLYYAVEFAIFIFCFPDKCGLFHDGSAYLGFCILCFLTVVCSGHSNGMYGHSCCLSHCLGFGFSDMCLLSCHLLSKSLHRLICLFKTCPFTPDTV